MSCASSMRCCCLREDQHPRSPHQCQGSAIAIASRTALLQKSFGQLFKLGRRLECLIVQACSEGPQQFFCDQRIKRAKSLRIGKLIFRNDPLGILRLALDAVSKTSVCLDGHMLNDGVNHWWIRFGTSLWTLRLVANVFIQLIGIWHAATSRIGRCSSVDRAMMQCILLAHRTPAS